LPGELPRLENGVNRLWGPAELTAEPLLVLLNDRAELLSFGDVLVIFRQGLFDLIRQTVPIYFGGTVPIGRRGDNFLTTLFARLSVFNSRFSFDCCSLSVFRFFLGKMTSRLWVAFDFFQCQRLTVVFGKPPCFVAGTFWRTLLNGFWFRRMADLNRFRRYPILLKGVVVFSQLFSK